MHLTSQSGGASIVTVGFISIFILLLTVSITRLMTGELQQARELENNVQAYYEAEGGVEEAVLALRQLVATNPGALLADTTQQNCDKSEASGANMDKVLNNFGAAGTSFAHNPNITCRRVRTASNFVSSTLNIEDSAHYDLSRKNFARIEIEWDSENLRQESSEQDFTDLQQQPPAPPFLEMTRIEYEDTDAGPSTQIIPDNVRLKSLYLAPIRTGVSDCGSPSINFDACNGADGGRVKIRCTTTPVYRCKATITGFMPTVVTSKRTVLRLRPYFSAMQYTMKIYDNLNNRVDVALDKTIIDVTAKVGSSYRRIEQEVSIVPQPLDNIEAVFGDDKVCKKFVIFDNGSGEGVFDIPNNCRLN